MDGKLKKAGCLFSAGFFKKVLMMMFVLNVCIGKLAAVYGNNVRISGEPDVQLNASSDSLSLTFTLSWDNSWRDNFNWDAVWLFVKYKKEGSTDAWSHLYLGGDQTGTSVLEIDPGNTGNQVVGAFVYPKNKGAFNIAGERVTLKASLNGLSASDISDKKVYFAVSAIEMVLIPYGAYYLGDGVSNHTFKSYNIPMIPPEADIIGTSSEFNYSCEPKNYRTSYACNAADRINNAAWDETHAAHISLSDHGSAVASVNNTWTVDFVNAKTILTFGVSIPNFSDIHTDYIPGEDWYLLGSGDGFTWDTLQRCDPSWVTKDVNSYPVRRAIRVSSPGAYRYYRLFFPKMKNNGYMLSNVAMSEQDLYPNGVDEYKYITSEDAITFGNSVVDGLYAADGNTWSGILPETYPKGYKGFYIMKYELSQEQYCNFLNMLSYTQQKSRIGNNLDNLNRGDYVFGNPKSPSCRNGIAVFSRKNTSQPAVFGCNLNPAEPFFDKDDGQTLACNYMTGADMLAYLDWSGLRPMSELEYEKACRTPNRVTPGEYAWNTTSVTPLGGQSGLLGSTFGTENESPVNVNTNANSGVPSFGPVRCGSFGTSSTNQEQSGGSFYGVMELSGNLGEMCYSVTGGSSLNTIASQNEHHGDGVLATNGDFNVVTYWNRSNDATALSIRGGSFASPNSYLHVSDRRVMMGYNNTTRDSSVTFRGVRSLRHVIDPGKIGSDATCPGLVTIQSLQAARTYGDSSYVWYVKRPENTAFELIEGEHGANLVDYDVVSVGRAATVAYTFRRKVMTLTDEAYTDFTLTVPNMLWQISHSVAELDVCDIFKEITATSVVSGANYEWSYNGNVLSETSVYVPLRKDFNGVAGNFEIKCIIRRGVCSDKKLLRVNVTSTTVVPSTAVTMANCGTVSFRDNRDGQEYCTVKIGTQCWMGRNLNIGDFRSISQNNLHSQVGIQKHCLDDIPSNCDKYGGLYRWYETVYGERTDGEKMVGSNAQGICPDGWHFPWKTEYETLISYAGGMSGLKVSSKNWCSGEGCNTTGFNALLCGCYPFRWVRTETTYWAYPDRWRYVMYAGSSNWGQENPEIAYSIRCIKD